MGLTFNPDEYITPQKRPRKKPETPVRKWTAEERNKLCDLKRVHGDLTIEEFHRAFDSYFQGRSAGAIHQEWLHLKKDPSRQFQPIKNTLNNSRPVRSKIVILKMNKRPLSSPTGPVDFPSKEPRLERQSSPEASDDDDGDVDFDGQKQRFQTSSSKSPSVPRQHQTTLSPKRASQPHPAQQNQQLEPLLSATSSQWSQSGPMALGANATPQTHLKDLAGAEALQPGRLQKSGITQPLPQGHTTVSANQRPNHPPHGTASPRTFVNAGVDQHNRSTILDGTNGIPPGQESCDARNKSINSNDSLTKAVPTETPMTASPSSHRSELPPNNAPQPKPYPTTQQNIPASTAPSHAQPPLYISNLTKAQCLQLMNQIPIRLTQLWNESDQALINQCTANEALARNLEALQSRLLDMEKKMEDMKRERASDGQRIASLESFRQKFTGLVDDVKQELRDDNAGRDTQEVAHVEGG